MDQYPFEFNYIMLIDEYEQMIEQLGSNEETKHIAEAARKQLHDQIKNI